MIFLSPPHMSGKELEYIEDVFKSNYIAPVGEYLDKFENKIKEYCNISNALGVINATSALHLALRVLGVGKDEIVLSSTFTFIGSVAPILYVGAKPVFIDSDESWNLSPKLLEEALKKLPKKPKALIVTHLYGQMADIEQIAKICKEHNIYLIEDAAESLGATYNNKQSGTFGDFGVYSFNGNKILTTSGGGMLVSKNKEWIDKAHFLATQAKEDALYYQHQEFGYNYRLSNVLAAIGVAQMEVLDERIAKTRAIFAWYKEQLQDVEEIELMPELPDSFGNRWLTTITLKKSDPFKLVQKLQENGIEARPLWKPMHLQPLFENEQSFLNGVSEDLFNRGLCLPTPTNSSFNELEKVIKVIKKYVS